MNKVTNINLGGFPFAIDENAYAKLDNYFEAIENHFKHSEGFEEITSDIEYRIAEIFNERMGKRLVISSDDIDEVISIMGQPHEFDGELNESTAKGKKSKASGSYVYVKTGKKIYRDPENKVLGGVCSGLAAYFGIADPLWVRALFVVLTFAGISPILYPILLLVIPKAKTTSDRLAMHGEPINVSNISKAVEQEISELSSKISEIANDIKLKKK